MAKKRKRKPQELAWTQMLVEVALERAAVPAISPVGILAREGFLELAARAYDVTMARFRLLTVQFKDEAGAAPPLPPPGSQPPGTWDWRVPCDCRKSPCDCPPRRAHPVPGSQPPGSKEGEPHG